MKKQLEKGARAFLFFILGFEVGANRFKIKFCFRISDSFFFFKNVGMVPEKAARLENPL